MTAMRETPVERRFGGRSEKEARRELADSIKAMADNPLSGDDGLRLLGTIIDLSDDLENPEGINLAIRRGAELLATESRPDRQALLHYFLANAWETRRQLGRSPAALREWEHLELSKVIIHLRLATRIAEEHVARTASRKPSRRVNTRDISLDTMRLAQMYTNLANHMSHCGRLLDALAYWDRALEVQPGFPMALGNRGYGLLQLTSVLEDQVYRAAYVREAHGSLSQALTPKTAGRLHEDARSAFERFKADIEKKVSPRVLSPLGHSHAFRNRMPKAERTYREWVLHERLFLNPLNDIGVDPQAARDTATLPGITTPIKHGPPAITGLFNQLKQEFVSARYLYYAAIVAEHTHFSDRDVLLADTLDYPAYGFAAECAKASYRMAYSLFDKIAFCLNEYFRLGIPEREINFRSVWFTKQDPTKGIRANFHEPKNGPLMGLYWIAKDLHERDSSFVEALDPDAKASADIRNHLEHKYVKLHEIGPLEASERSGELDRMRDPIAYSVNRYAFERRTLGILRTARTGLMQLTQAVLVEEYLRRKKYKRGTKTATIPLFEFKEEFKR
jgi:tetratricopeptide (TPR) repeat protein